MTIPFQVNPHQIFKYGFYDRRILVLKKPAWVIQRTGSVILSYYLKIFGFMFPH